MAGIYIHIPFCRKACHYCNFHFSTSLRQKNEFIAALLKEIEITGSIAQGDVFSNANYLQSETVDTIYFGGGTPSLLETSDLSAIIAQLRAYHSISDTAEITLESNPDDINVIKLTSWKDAGINRLSMGVQSFFDADLQWMNRAHDSRQAYSAIQQAQSAGFNNMSIDLIYGTPTLSDEAWEQNVRTAIDMNIPHLSCYALTVEPSTALKKMVETKKLQDVDPEKQANQFLLLMKWMEEAGYEHYEVSNFAKPGWRSKHNSSYWQGKNYLGLGPSAHSYNGVSRSWNVSNNALYIESLRKNVLPFEKEELTTNQRVNEYIMTALRTVEGIDLLNIERYGAPVFESLNKSAVKYIKSGKMEKNGTFLQLTRQGKLYADGIAADLFI